MQIFEDAATVSLQPPVLNSKTILKKVSCTRPMREGRFNISSEMRNGKEIVHCYGHGGSGWTTLFGSVEKAIGFVNKGPIRVVGSGCIGLAAAIELARRGFEVRISTKERYDLCSWKAAGYFALVSVKTSPEEQERLHEIGEATFRVYQQIEQGRHPYLSSDAVRYLPAFCSKETDSGLEDLEKRGLIPPRKEVILDFGNGVRHEGFVQYMTYFIDTTQMMKQLTAEVERLGIPIELEEIASFDQVREGVIFNCSGMGGRELNHDRSIIPIRGHLVLLKEEAGWAHMDYIIYTQVKGGEYVYMFPKAMDVSSDAPEGISCQSALGGSFIPGCDKLTAEELEKLDQHEFEKLLDRNSLFFHGVPYRTDIT